MRTIGIDPGLGGAVAMVEDRKLIWVQPCPVIKNKGKSLYALGEMATLIEDSDAGLAILEKVHAMPGQGVTSMFTFGGGFMAWEMALTCFNVPYILVTPQRWQKEMLDSMAGDTKVRSVMAANRLCPELHLKKSEHGKADAILMAMYGQGR